MKTIISIFVILILLPIAAKADDVTDWTTTDTIMQIGVSALLEIDRRQTQWIASHPYEITGHTSYTESGVAISSSSYKTHAESNRIIGYGAHKDRINAYFAVAATGHAVVSYALPYIVKFCGGNDKIAKYSRTIWQSSWITAEAHTVGRNYSLGVGMKF